MIGGTAYIKTAEGEWQELGSVTNVQIDRDITDGVRFAVEGRAIGRGTLRLTNPEALRQFLPVNNLCCAECGGERVVRDAWNGTNYCDACDRAQFHPERCPCDVCATGAVRAANEAAKDDDFLLGLIDEPVAISKDEEGLEASYEV